MYDIITNEQAIPILQKLLAEPNDIEQININVFNLSKEAYQLLNNILMADNCKIKKLAFIGSFVIYNEEEVHQILSIIKYNSTLEHLSIGHCSCHNLYELLANTLEHHPSIKHLHLNLYDSAFGLFGFLEYKPKTLQYLILKTRFRMDYGSIKTIIIFGNMKSIDITRVYYVYDIDDDFDIFKNTTLLDFKYDSSIVYQNPKFRILINKLLKRNNNSRNNARKIAISLVAIKSHRKTKCGLLQYVPKELVTEMAKYIFESYSDKEWINNSFMKNLK